MRLMLFRPATLAVAISLLATGCGGPSKEERFAESVCAAILPSAKEMLELQDRVVHTRAGAGRDARVTIQLAAVAGLDNAMRLRSRLSSLSVPNSDAGRAAASILDNISRSAYETMAREDRRAQQLPASITLLESTRRLERLELSLSLAYAQMLNYDFIGARVPELRKPLEEADSCKELDALRTDG